MVYKKVMRVDDFLLIYLLGNDLYVVIRDLTQSLISLDYGLFALEKQKEFLDFAENYKEIKLLPTTSEQVPENCTYYIKNLKFHYASESNYCLEIPELKIPVGKVIALVGPNGSG